MLRHVIEQDLGAATWASPQSQDGRTGGPTTRVRGPVNR